MVTTPDAFHHEYIVRALKKGCDVYSEKPITIDEEKCRVIRRAEKEAGKNVHVTFNCRFMPYFAKIKEVVASGIIGRPLSVQYDYHLTHSHGGDYFKRWHRFMNMSGGMMVHKATHHFDVVNWILDDEPESVSAQGARLFFGNEEKAKGERCFECEYKDTCISNGFNGADLGFLKKFYCEEAELVDGYQRDHCAFKADTDIYDSMSVAVRYKKGALLTYSLNLFNPLEGFYFYIIGEKGRLEFTPHVMGENNSYQITIRHSDGRKELILFPVAEGTHGGGDARMLAMLFGGMTEDPLGQCADSFDGIKSAMIGIAANRSIKEGVRVDLTPILDEMR